MVLPGAIPTPTARWPVAAALSPPPPGYLLPASGTAHDAPAVSQIS